MTTPTASGLIGGWGQTDRGRALTYTRTGPDLYERRPQDCKIFVNQTSLWLTDDVALQLENVSRCFLVPMADRPDKRSNKYEEELEALRARPNQRPPPPRRRLRQ